MTIEEVYELLPEHFLISDEELRKNVQKLGQRQYNWATGKRGELINAQFKLAFCARIVEQADMNI